MGVLNEISMGLFDPGMTHLHRIGLAGLYMTLKQLDKYGESIAGLSWSLSKDRVYLSWQDGCKEAFESLCRRSFNITREEPSGIIDFTGHRSINIGDSQKVLLHNSILSSFLQHNKQNNIPKGTQLRSAITSLDNKQVVLSYRPLINPFQHSKGADQLFNKQGRLKSTVAIKSWLYPGAAVRHIGYSSKTEIEVSIQAYICLLYAPVASLYFKLYHRGVDGKYDKRKGIAICLPHLSNLETYASCFEAYLESPVERLSADSLGDAALSALTLFRARDSLYDLEVSGCTVITMGSIGWSKQQQTRTGMLSTDNIDDIDLDCFEIALRCFKNKIIVYNLKSTKKEPKAGKGYFVATSLLRGFVANNIIEGKEWFCGFCQLMNSGERSKLVSYERKGLREMVEHAIWDNEKDKLMVEAVHSAIRSRYGALAARSQEKGERIPFDREYERIRTGLMRSKNAQTLREELADLFARGGANRILQEHWRKVLPLFTGEDWQRARDLALLGLASYSGKGAEDLETGESEFNEEVME